ncbi:MAG: hypothetical protein AB7O79_08755 [Xanthobacteraceae bacterium]
MSERRGLLRTDVTEELGVSPATAANMPDRSFTPVVADQKRLAVENTLTRNNLIPASNKTGTGRKTDKYQADNCDFQGPLHHKAQSGA